MQHTLAALLVGAGLSLLAVGFMVRSRGDLADLAAILDLPQDARSHPVTVSPSLKHVLLEPGVRFFDAGLRRFNLSQRLAEQLERGRVPLRPGEFALLTLAASLATSIAVWLLSASPPLGLVAILIVPVLAWKAVTGKVVRRRKAFESQLPDALTLVASSLEAGHTFLRSIEMMVTESEPPICQEFERVLAETRLGDPLIEALQRMSDRVQIDDLAWVVHAIRIQQTVGGKLGELLSTLAEFMRSREEIRREVRVLTAEGRLSAHILGGLPLFMLGILQFLNPAYIKPLFHGTGLIVLALAGGSVGIGIRIIKKMARVEV